MQIRPIKLFCDNKLPEAFDDAKYSIDKNALQVLLYVLRV